MNLFRRGPRARRGDIRHAILALLAEQPRNGYQIMQELEQRSRGMWRPSPGAVYPALQQLEDERMVAVEVSGGGRVFHLTDKDKKAAAAEGSGREAPWEAASQTAGTDIHLTVGLLGTVQLVPLLLFALWGGAYADAVVAAAHVHLADGEIDPNAGRKRQHGRAARSAAASRAT